MVAQAPSVLLPPTVRLPPQGLLASTAPEAVTEALRYLRWLYNPEVRGSRRLKTKAKANEGNNDYFVDLDALRSDAFERTYTMRWLTAVISHASAFEPASNADDSATGLVSASNREAILTAASSLLAVCSGSSAAGAINREFTFGDGLIHVTVNDAPLENQRFESVGAQTWGGACVLSELIVERPASFTHVHSQEMSMRVLELGAGTGLVSLTLGKLLQSLGMGGEIVASDFYPLVLSNLKSNILANFPSTSSSLSITANFFDWSLFPTIQTPDSPFDNKFDLILGADIVYEPLHSSWIKACLLRLLHRSGLFHLVIPLRPTHRLESRSIEDLFPLCQTRNVECVVRDLELVIVEKEIIVCEAGIELKEEVEYGYYKIRWGVPCR